jgi:hypothetical protein
LSNAHDGRPLCPCQTVQAPPAAIALAARLGRLIRDIGRKIVGQPQLQATMAADARQTNPLAAAAPARLEALFLDAPEVECIGKGKASAPYEFGVKGLDHQHQCPS